MPPIDTVYAPQQLHIPDGFISTPVAVVGWLLAALVIAVALRHSERELGPRQAPLMGVLAAFIFAAQAVNFPVAAGTSGHLLGGALAAIVLGPWAAVLVMTAVIALQALLFQDGGLLVMGWNIINMGVLTAFTGALVYTAMRRLMGSQRNHWVLIGAGVLGGWLSVQAGAAATAVELAASGTTPLGLALPAMLVVHALIGIGEAAITTAALLALVAARPDLLERQTDVPGMASATLVWVGLMVALGVAVFSFAASPHPDGLERVAADFGFLGNALDAPMRLLPDYTVPLLHNKALSGIVAVGLGTVLVFALGAGAAQWLNRRRAVTQSEQQ